MAKKRKELHHILQNLKMYLKRLTHARVDEVFILQPDHLTFPTKLLDELMVMGVAVDYTVTSISDDR